MDDGGVAVTITGARMAVVAVDDGGIAVTIPRPGLGPVANDDDLVAIKTLVSEVSRVRKIPRVGNSGPADAAGVAIDDRPVVVTTDPVAMLPSPWATATEPWPVEVAFAVPFCTRSSPLVDTLTLGSADTAHGVAATPSASPPCDH